MTKSDVIYLYVWSGDAKRARDLVGSRYPGIEIREFPHRRLRESSVHGANSLASRLSRPGHHLFL